jgi:two-component system response regulator PilR (NtrC family)
VVGIRLPTLKERQEDIPLLVHALLKKLAKNSEKRPVVTSSAMQILCGYHYPGNVRELENILERALVLSGDVILPEHLSECLESPTYRESATAQPETRIIIDDELELPIKLDDLLARIERSYIEQALAESSGVKKKAASLLGMNFRSFRYRLQKYEIAGE